MSFFFAFPFARVALFLFASLAALAFGAQEGRAEDRNPLYGITDWMGLTAPTGDRPDFVRESRPDEKGMDFVPFIAPEKKRIPVKTADQIGADESALLAEKQKATGRLKKLNSEAVQTLPSAPKPPPMTDKF
jgi:hypothetical protein